MIYVMLCQTLNMATPFGDTDDMVILSPSANALQKLLDKTCSVYSEKQIMIL